MFMFFKPASTIIDPISSKTGMEGPSLLRLCMGVLGSGENSVKKFREQGAWGQKDHGVVSKGKYFREQGAEDDLGSTQN